MGYSRHAIQYNSVGLFLTDSPAAKPATTNIHFFNRTQSVALGIDVARQNIQHIGGEEFLDRKIVSEANTTLNFEYLLTDGHEEKTLGLNISSGVHPLSNGTIYSNIKEDKSAFLVVGEEGLDLTGYSRKINKYSGLDVIGIGNCFITNYSISADVGGVARASVAMVGSNVRYSCVGADSWTGSVGGLGYLLSQLDTFLQLEDEGKLKVQGSDYVTTVNGVGFPSLNLEDGGTEIKGPPISYTTEDNQGNEITRTIENPGTGLRFEPMRYKAPVAAIPPGGINVKLKNINVGGPLISGVNEGACIKGDANIQGFNISLPFAREDLKGFGSMHVYGRKMKYPQLGTISFSILSSAFNSGNLKNLFCDDEVYNIEIDLNNQCDFTCRGSSKHASHLKFIINNAKLKGHSLSESIGSLATVDCSFTFGISRKNGFFMSGSYT